MFLYSLWCNLPLNKRHEIAHKFNIPKKGPTEVMSNVIKSDGYTVHDIEGALTKEALQEKLETEETDMNVLWEYLVNGKPQPEVGVVVGASETLEHFVEPEPTLIKEEKIDKIRVITTPPIKKGRSKKS